VAGIGGTQRHRARRPPARPVYPRLRMGEDDALETDAVTGTAQHVAECGNRRADGQRAASLTCRESARTHSDGAQAVARVADDAVAHIVVEKVVQNAANNGADFIPSGAVAVALPQVAGFEAVDGADRIAQMTGGSETPGAGRRAD